MRKKSKSKTLTADWVWGGVFGVLLSIMVLTIIFFGDIGVVSERSNINADSIYTKRSSLVTVVRKQQAIALRPEVHQDFFQINERLSSNVETEMRLISDIGTGFVLGEYIITNRHVAGEPSEYAVIDYRGRHFEVIDVY
ncbi:MAG: S1C family serine protease, partial [Pseudomonadales bacterium]|nr:S1C family serine protease [Pseudomonadales bacterium]